jgi:tRNA nucleotidyltransferase (CCA-adding enzyme)
MLRAARLESRMGFHLDPRSEELITDALPLLKRVSGDRIRHELEQIFREAEPERAAVRLDELGVLAHVHPSLRCDKWLQAKYRAIREELKHETWNLKPEEAPFLHLALLAYRLDDEELEGLIARLMMPRDEAEVLRLLRSLKGTLPQLGKARRPSAIYRLLQPYPARAPGHWPSPGLPPTAGNCGGGYCATKPSGGWWRRN